MSALHEPAPQDIEPPFGGSAFLVADPLPTGVAVMALFVVFAGWAFAEAAGSAAPGAASGDGGGAALAAAVAVAVLVVSEVAAEAAADAAGAGAAAAAAAAGGSGLAVARSALLQPTDALAPRTARAATNVSKVSEGLRMQAS
jgi:hypothetical protein